MKKTTLITLFALAVLLIAGCSGQNHAEDTVEQPTASQASPAPAAPAVAAAAPAPRATALETPSSGEIRWLSWNEAVAAQAETPKKIFVDVYTDWCGWCKVMDRQTFTDPEVIKYMNDNFYAVKFNAEKEDPLTFRGQEYKVVSGGRRGIHTLAYALLDGQLSYPSYVYLNEKFERMHISKGFKPADPFLQEVRGITGASVQ